MIGRRRRALDAFNLSMLDVIASALGAILILFIVSSMDAGAARQALRARDGQLERLNAEMARLDEALRARAAALEAVDDAEAARLACPPEGLAIGMCRVDAPRVAVHVYDHRKLDGDRVDLLFNREPLERDVPLTGADAGIRLDLALRPGANYLAAVARSEGADPPNTATVVVSPCRDGRPESFQWDMTSGEQRHVSIIRASRR